MIGCGHGRGHGGNSGHGCQEQQDRSQGCGGQGQGAATAARGEGCGGGRKRGDGHGRRAGFGRNPEDQRPDQAGSLEARQRDLERQVAEMADLIKHLQQGSVSGPSPSAE
jgi:hypothetical protein